MKKVWLGALAAAVVGTVGGAALAADLPANIKAAIADAKRPEPDKARDANRHPGELLAWAGVKPGAKVEDFMMGGGYFTRILAPAVGPKGHVYAYQAAEFIGMRAAYGEDQKKVVADYPNVTALNDSVTTHQPPSGLDLVITVQNYHDLHWSRMPTGAAAKVNAAVFKALKPGGVYLVVDHVANPGTGDEAPGKLHRIDPAIIKQEVTAAGFKFEGESDLLRNPADDHTKGVFDPSLRGRTDQVAYKFRKPR